MSGPHPTTVRDAVPVRIWSNPKSRPWGVRIEGEGPPAFVGKFSTKAKAAAEADRILEYSWTIQEAAQKRALPKVEYETVPIKFNKERT